MLFALAGQEFEDKRLTMEQWKAIKEDTIMSQLPVLHTDDISLSQSHAIERFVARKFGFDGKSELDKARVDMLVDCVEQFMKEGGKFVFEKDEKRKAEAKEIYEKETLPKTLTSFENFLKSNKGGEGYFVGDSITTADIAFANFMDALERPMAGITYDHRGKHPLLWKFVDRVFSEPRIAEWLAKRPKTMF